MRLRLKVIDYEATTVSPAPYKRSHDHRESASINSVKYANEKEDHFSGSFFFKGRFWFDCSFYATGL